jgi:periplasmic protein TonB
LARLCLPEAMRESDMKFAWMNSICLLFLGIGCFGNSSGVHIKPAPPQENIIPAIVEQVVPPQQPTIMELKPEQMEQPEKQDAPQIVVVTPDAPNINFSVPTIGNLVAPAALAVAPPLRPMIAPVAKPAAALPLLPATLDSTGTDGERPLPPYPPAAVRKEQQGTVALLLTVDDTGGIATIQLKETSGYPILDSSTVDFVKRRWRVPPRDGSRAFEIRVKYKLEGK